MELAFYAALQIILNKTHINSFLYDEFMCAYKIGWYHVMFLLSVVPPAPLDNKQEIRNATAAPIIFVVNGIIDHSITLNSNTHENDYL